MDTLLRFLSCTQIVTEIKVKIYLLLDYLILIYRFGLEEIKKFYNSSLFQEIYSFVCLTVDPLSILEATLSFLIPGKLCELCIREERITQALITPVGLFHRLSPIRPDHNPGPAPHH